MTTNLYNFFSTGFKSCDTQYSPLKRKEKNQTIEFNDKPSEASFKVSYLIAKETKLHTIGEALALPAAVKNGRNNTWKRIWHSFISKYCWKTYRKQPKI